MCRGKERSVILFYGNGKGEGKINFNVEIFFLKYFSDFFIFLDLVILFKIINLGKLFKKRKKLYIRIYL